MLRPYIVLAIQQVFHPPQIPRSFFSDRRREQYGPRHRHACRDHRLRHRDQRGEAARVVRNARALEPLAAPLHRDVHLGPEDRVEMRRQYDRRGLFAIRLQPPVDITRVIDHDVVQADRAEQLRHVRGAPAFRARGRGNGGQCRLAGERPLIGALDVMARRANAIVREQAGNKVVHQSDSQCSHKPPAARRKRAAACDMRLAACGLWLSGRHLLMDERELIYDWNRAGGEGGPAFDWSRVRVDLNDETLRDGLQSPSVRDPALEVKKRLLHLMADLGIVAADIGLPGAGPRVVEQVRALATEIRNTKLPIAPNCAARTVIADIEPIVRVTQEVGITIEAATFIGSSPIRQYAEDWTLDRIVQSTVDGVTYAVKHGLPVMYVTEDTTRAKPEALKALYGAAIDCGATRICLADTVGHATPAGVKALVEFVKREIVKQNRVKVDWHGHRDRGLGLINCLTAIEAGVDRVHGTALGVGERVGNAEMDLLIVNLKLLGAHAHDISKLPEYCRLVADAVGAPTACCPTRSATGCSSRRHGGSAVPGDRAVLLRSAMAPGPRGRDAGGSEDLRRPLWALQPERPHSAPRRAQIHRIRPRRDHGRRARRRNRPYGPPERDPGHPAAFRARAPAGDEPRILAVAPARGLALPAGPARPHPGRARGIAGGPAGGRAGAARRCASHAGRAGAGVRGNGAAHQRGRAVARAGGSLGTGGARRGGGGRGGGGDGRVRPRPGALARERIRSVRAG